MFDLRCSANLVMLRREGFRGRIGCDHFDKRDVMVQTLPRFERANLRRCERALRHNASIPSKPLRVLMCCHARMKYIPYFNR